MGRIQNTLALAKTSWSVLKKDRELMWLPVLSFLVSAAVGGAALAVVLVTRSAAPAATSGAADGVTVSPVAAVVGIVAALALGITSVFFNGALVAGAHERLTGGDPTVGSSVRRAFSRLAGLVPWALLTTTVGLVLQAMRERAGFLGRIVVDMIGMAWDVVTFLVIPAVVIDELGAVDGLKRSAGLLRQTWGENLIARVGFGLLGFVLVIPAVIVVMLAGAAGFIWVGLAVAVAWVVVVAVVLTALNAIFQTALYMYATTGVVPQGFEGTTLSQSFGHK